MQPGSEKRDGVLTFTPRAREREEKRILIIICLGFHSSKMECHLSPPFLHIPIAKPRNNTLAILPIIRTHVGVKHKCKISNVSSWVYSFSPFLCTNNNVYYGKMLGATGSRLWKKAFYYLCEKALFSFGLCVAIKKIPVWSEQGREEQKFSSLSSRIVDIMKLFGWVKRVY